MELITQSGDGRTQTHGRSKTHMDRHRTRAIEVGLLSFRQEILKEQTTEAYYVELKFNRILSRQPHTVSDKN